MSYHNPAPANSYWPHAIAGLLLAFMAVQFTLVRIATTGFEGPDQVEYYKMGIEFSKEVQRQKAQRDLRWSLTQESTPEGLRVWLRDAAGQALHGKLSATFKRPATKTQDYTLEGRPVGQTYLFAAPGPGRWIVAYRFECDGQIWLGTQRL